MKNIIGYFSTWQHLRNYRDALVSDIQKRDKENPTITIHTETRIKTVDEEYILLVFNKSNAFIGTRADEVKVDKTLMIESLDTILPIVGGDWKRVTFVNMKESIINDY
jgi:hypothetical protein